MATPTIKNVPALVTSTNEATFSVSGVATADDTVDLTVKDSGTPGTDVTDQIVLSGGDTVFNFSTDISALLDDETLTVEVVGTVGPLASTTVDKVSGVADPVVTVLTYNGTGPDDVDFTITGQASNTIDYSLEDKNGLVLDSGVDVSLGGGGSFSAPSPVDVSSAADGRLILTVTEKDLTFPASTSNLVTAFVGNNALIGDEETLANLTAWNEIGVDVSSLADGTLTLGAVQEDQNFDPGNIDFGTLDTDTSTKGSVPVAITTISMADESSGTVDVSGTTDIADVGRDIVGTIVDLQGTGSVAVAGTVLAGGNITINGISVASLPDGLLILDVHLEESGNEGPATFTTSKKGSQTVAGTVDETDYAATSGVYHVFQEDASAMQSEAFTIRAIQSGAGSDELRSVPVVDAGVKQISGSVIASGINWDSLAQDVSFYDDGAVTYRVRQEYNVFHELTDFAIEAALKTDVTVVVSGSGTPTTSEQSIRDGARIWDFTLTGGTLEVTLTTVMKNAIRDSIVSDGIEAGGWDAIKSTINADTAISRISGTLARMTLPALATHAIDANESLTVDFPAIAMSDSTADGANAVVTTIVAGQEGISDDVMGVPAGTVDDMMGVAAGTIDTIMGVAQ